MSEIQQPELEPTGRNNTIVLVAIISLLVFLIAAVVLGAYVFSGSQTETVSEEGETAVKEDVEEEANEANDDERIPIIFSIHTESSSSRTCDDTEARCATDEEWEELLGVTERMIEVFDENGLKGTFQLQSLWMIRLQDSDRGNSIIQAMVDGGHEIAVHRHGFTHNDWDGYSDDPEAVNGHDRYTGVVAKPMSELMDIIHALEDEWGIQITTVEGTDLTIDRSDEWIFQTGDDGNHPNPVDLHDPDNYCPEGRPTWSRITLPNDPSSQGGTVTTLAHTWMGAQTGDCTRTVGAHILEIMESYQLGNLDSDEVINIVYHPKDLATSSDNEAAFHEIFEAMGEMDQYVGMTVQEYMCDRLDKCLD